MNPMEQFEADVATDPYAPLHDRLARNDGRLVEELVTLRKKKRLSQDTVARRMNRSKTAVSNFERLGADPHLSTIRRYAAAVGAQITSCVHDYDHLVHQFDDASIQVQVTLVRRKDRRAAVAGDVELALGNWT